MLGLVDSWLAPHGVLVGTPRNPEHRGGHIIITHPDAAQIAHALRTIKNTVPDYREPNAIRLAISPLATSYQEVWDGFDRLRDLLDTGDYRSVDLGASRVT